MLNLLRFREFADYSETPELAPIEPISGEKAYQLYIKHTFATIWKNRRRNSVYGSGAHFLIGPGNEKWDSVY